MVTVGQQYQEPDKIQEDNQHEEEHREKENGGQNSGNHRGVTIRDIDECITIDYPSDSGDGYSLEDRGYGTADAICVQSEQDLRRLDREDVSHTSSTQYSDVDDSLEEDELGSWSNDLVQPVSLQQHFDNGVALPVSEVPSFGDVNVKNSQNVHVGNKTFYNGPVTIKQIVYANPNLSLEEEYRDVGNGCGDNVPQTSANGFANSDGYGNPDGTASKTVDSQNPEVGHKVGRWCAFLLTWRCVALMSAMGSCLVAAVVVSVVLLTRDSDSPLAPVFPEIPDGSIDGDGEITSKLRFVERAEWGAQPPTVPLDKLVHPVPYVIISHTATDFCTTQSTCTFRVRFAQTFHIESRNWSDIAYNFLIGGDGYAYVGRSWDFVGAHSYGYNTKSIGISFIGTFNNVVPPKRQLHAVQQLIEFGVQGGKISPDYKLLGHRQISETLSPGTALYNVLKTWPHWSPKP